MKKCAVINDISGFGKCSLTASIPVMSAIGVQVNPVVTGVFTNQTGYDCGYKSVDLTDMLPDVRHMWKTMGAQFDGILTGFLLHERQGAQVIDFIREFKGKDTLLLVDPVMADDGEMYDLYTPKMVDCIKELCTYADVITPNVTELKLLSGEDDIAAAAQKMLAQGIKSVIVTGSLEGENVCTYVFSAGECRKFTSRYIKTEGQGGSLSGTGDIFASFVMAKLLCGCDVFTAASQAVEFISAAIEASDIKDRNDGIDFEPFLKNI